jgi:molybdopterin-guanine dinucleotide biosynthesis protein
MVVAVSGFSSDAGKTALACRLLTALPGWEAVKVTKGHYRSCGKDPHACCVSHLLSDAPLVVSGREQTYSPGKDTGRYWDAGAANVHWVIATRERVVDGVRQALSLVAPEAPGVIVEGTGFVRSMTVDVAIMVARAGQREMKASAAAVFPLVDALYLFGADSGDHAALDRVRELLAARRVETPMPPAYFEADLPRLVEEIANAHQRPARYRTRL